MQKALATLFLFFLGIATVLGAGILAAQEPSPTGNPAEEGAAPNGKHRRGEIEARLENLSKQLNLTDEQKRKIRPALKHEMERIARVQSNSSLSQVQERRRIAMIRADTRDRISEILTPDQRKQWEAMREAHRGEGGVEKGRPAPEGSANPASPQNPPNAN